MPTLGHICRDTRARAAKCWNFGAIFTPKNRSQFSIIQTDFWKKIWNLETICNNAPDVFSRNLSSNWIYLASKLVKKRKIGRVNFFLLNLCGFCREKNSKNSGRGGKNSGHLVQPVQLFESTKFRDYTPTLTCYIFWLVHAIGMVYIPFCRA